MLKTLSLILPVLIPSWQFFRSIEPSPRIEWRCEGEVAWKELRPLPLHVPLPQMLGRLFWNPAWNESLFLVSCAERIKEAPTAHSIAVIQGHVTASAAQFNSAVAAPGLRFRLMFVHRTDVGLSQDVVFVSEPFAAIDDINL